MKYLFSYKYKKIGWFLLVPASIIGLVTVFGNFQPSWLEFSVPAIFSESYFGNESSVITENNILDEILGLIFIAGAILVSFSKEEQEDEFISKIRLESLVWATYVSYGILFLAIIFVYELSFYWVMLFNMFTILIFFIVRFNWQIIKLKNSFSDEK